MACSVLVGQTSEFWFRSGGGFLKDVPAKIELELEFQFQIVGQTSEFQFRAGGVFLWACQMHSSTVEDGPAKRELELEFVADN